MKRMIAKINQDNHNKAKLTQVGNLVSGKVSAVYNTKDGIMSG